jgi:class 3 adenylate cyclase
VTAEVRIRSRALATRIAQRLTGPAESILGFQTLIVEDLTRSGPPGALADALRVREAAETLNALVTRLVSPDGEGLIAAMDEAELRHDLRNPVNAILGYSELLVEEYEEQLASTVLADIRMVITECARFLAKADSFLTEGEESDQTRLDQGIAAALERSLATPMRFASREAGRILVIDDVTANREILRRHLARWGHEVLQVSSAAAGLAVLGEEPMDLVLCDVLMPDMNGIEFLTRLKAAPDWHDLPVIMVSGLKETRAVVRCISAGAEDYLQKPIDPVLLHARVEASLERARLRRREKEFVARIEYERDRADSILHAMLPGPVISRLRDGEAVIADRIPSATIIFADIVDFTPMVARTEPSALLRRLSALFLAFDDIADRHGVEKIKTIGDAYMAAAGVPHPRPDHAQAAVAFARDLIATTRDGVGHGLQMRIGIHSGPVIAGLIGRKRFVYDIWGEAVNMASRLESSGRPGRIHVSEATLALLGEVPLESAGEIDLKGVGRVITYFLAP